MAAHLCIIVKGGGRDNHGSPRNGAACRSGTSKYRLDEPHAGIGFVDIWP